MTGEVGVVKAGPWRLGELVCLVKVGSGGGDVHSVANMNRLRHTQGHHQVRMLISA